MRDEIEARMWNDHHAGFSDAIERIAADIRSGLSRLSSWDGTTHQLFALVLAFAITALTFKTTAI